MPNFLFLNIKTNTLNGEIEYLDEFDIIEPKILEIAWIYADDYSNVKEESSWQQIDHLNNVENYKSLNINSNIKTQSLKNLLICLNDLVIKSDCLIFHGWNFEILRKVFSKNNVRYILPTIVVLDLSSIYDYIEEYYQLSYFTLIRLYDFLHGKNYKSKNLDVNSNIWMLFYCYWNLAKRKAIIIPDDYTKKYNISKLISARNQELFDEINKRTIIEYDYTYSWRTIVEDKKVIIFCDTNNFQEPFFSKMLLEIDYLQKGYKRIKTVYVKSSSNDWKKQQEFDAIERLVFTIFILFKEINVFNEYRILGYPINDFKTQTFAYDDDFKGEIFKTKYYNSIRGEYKLPVEVLYGDDNKSKLYNIVSEYLNFLSPSSFLNEDEKYNLKKWYKEFSNYEYTDIFDQLDSIYLIRTDIYFDNFETHIKKVFNLIELQDVWIGYNDGETYPENGFFVGNPFNTFLKRDGYFDHKLIFLKSE
jgi:hypothetical protein